MGKSVPITRIEYEASVKKHLEAVRRLAKRFNPEAYHISMTIIDDSLFTATYLPDDEAGHTRKISGWYYKTTDKGGVGPFYRSDDIPEGQFVLIGGDPDVQDVQDGDRETDEGPDDAGGNAEP